MKRLFVLLPLTLLGCISHGQTCQELELGDRNVPELVSATVKQLRQDRILLAYPDFRRPATRYEIAVAAHATYVDIRNAIRDLEDDSSIPMFEKGLEIEKLARYIEPLSGLVGEFHIELESLGVTTREVMLELKALRNIADAQWQPDRLARWTGA